MSDRYFGQFFNEADSLSTRPEFQKVTKVAHDSGGFTTQDLLTEATRLARPGSALARLGQQIGHPRYKELPFGQSERANAVVLFLDVRGFTRLSIELENDELIRILQKLSIACVATVYQHGGYIGDFTGDGIMAFFDKDEAALASLQAATDLLMGVRDFVNPSLKRDGDTGINVSVGIEYGEVIWTRIGLSHISQVKPVSEVTYVAGKLATRDHTSKWECCIGEQLASVIPDGLAKRVEGISYKQESTSGTYGVFSFDWERFDQRLATNFEGVRGTLRDSKLAARKRIANLAAAALPAAPAIVQSKRIPGPADAPVPPKNRQVG